MHLNDFVSLRNDGWGAQVHTGNRATVQGLVYAIVHRVICDKHNFAVAGAGVDHHLNAGIEVHQREFTWIEYSAEMQHIEEVGDREPGLQPVRLTNLLGMPLLVPGTLLRELNVRVSDRGLAWW